MRDNKSPFFDFSNYAVSLKYQFLFYLRSRRFLGLFLLVLIVSTAVSLLLVKYEYGILEAGDSSSFFNSYLSTFAVTLVALVAAFFGGDMASMDFGTDSAYYSLVQPIRRSTLFLGRYTAAVILTFVIILVYYIAAIFTSVYLYDSVTSEVLTSLYLVFLLTMALVAFAGFFSSIFKSPLVGIIVTVLFLVLIIPIIQGILSSFAGIEPWMFITYAGSIVSLVFLPSYPLKEVVRAHHFTTYTYNPAFSESIYIMLGYFVIFLAVTLLIFSRREIKG